MSFMSLVLSFLNHLGLFKMFALLSFFFFFFFPVICWFERFFCMDWIFIHSSGWKIQIV